MPIYTSDEPYGICLILLGIFIVLFSLIILWKNERRAVTLASLTYIARKACISADPVQPKEEHLLKLVHISGTAKNKEDL